MHKDIIIVGAGQYGIVASYFLKQQNCDFLVLEKNGRVGDNWRKRFESMKLFSPAKYNALPGLSIALDPGVRPTKNQMADYFERYIEHFDIPVSTNHEVTYITKEGSVFRLYTAQGEFTSDKIIIANGISQKPIVPSWLSKLAIPHIHTRNYRNPVSVKGKKVLVAGEGNSSAQIAGELVKYFDVDWAREQQKKFASLYIFGKNVYWWNEKIPWVKNKGGASVRPIYLYDDLKALLKKVNKQPPVEDANGSLVSFADGSSAQYDFIIYSEGYRPDFDIINIPDLEMDLDIIREAKGYSPIPGLIFIGVPYQRNYISFDISQAVDDVKAVIENI